MALALAKGFIAAKLVAPEQILVSAPSDRNLKTWRDDMNCITTHDNAKVIEESDIIFLSTKVTRDKQCVFYKTWNKMAFKITLEDMNF